MELELTIEPEFQALIPPLSSDEFASLKQQILQQGCLEPLYVWKNGDNRILLDGHNRYTICTENGVRFAFIKVPNVTSREEAKLWILEHQAGRRNLTDDQRAVVWNEIREQRSKIEQAKKLQKARDVKAGVVPVSAKSTEIAMPKKDTRAEIAKEAKLPENKLKQAQGLKKADSGLYEEVRKGNSTLREARKILRSQKTTAQPRKDRDYYCRISRALDGVFKGALREKLEDLVNLSQKDLTPSTKRNLRQIIVVLEEVSELADSYAKRIRAILQSDKKAA